MPALTINGATFNYPATGASNWGTDATNWAVAVTSGMLSKAGGVFTLASDVNFGASCGLLSQYFTSRSGSPASTGVLRLANADLIKWRNSANNGDIAFGPGSSDTVAAYAGVDIANISGAQTLTNKTMSGASNTFSNLPTSALTGSISAANGGTGVNTSASTGYPSIASGTWSVSSPSSTFTTLYETVTSTLGDTVYGATSGAPTRLAGNTTATKQFLTQTGTGSVSAAPVWGTVVAGDLPTIALSGDVSGSASGGSISTTAAATQSNITSVPNLATIGTIATGTWAGTTVATNHGGTGVTSVTTAATASAFAGWDANKNLSAVNLLDALTSTATAAGTTTLTVGSNYYQVFTGSTTQSVVLPAAATLANGQGFQIVNQSSGTVTVKTSGTNTVQAMTQNTVLTVVCVSTAGGTGTASWTWQYATIQNAGVAGTVTSVGMTVPTFLSVSPSTITSSGSFAITLSGTALPIANGGTSGTTQQTALNAIAPSSPANGQVIQFNGTNWVAATPAAGTKNYATALPTSNGTNTGNGNFEFGSTAGWSLAHSTLSSSIPTSTSAAGCAFGQYVFTVTAGQTASPGATFTNNTQTFTVLAPLTSGQTVFVCSGTGAPGASGTLTYATGTASGNITFSAVTSNSASSNLTLSAVSSGQLAGAYSGSIASSAASTAGDMLISNPFYIDTEDQAKVLQIKFYYTVHSGATNLSFTGTTAGSFAIWLYDVTNGAWIMPAGIYNLVQSSGVGYATATYQTTSNSTQYQLALVNITASGGAYTVYVDDFFVGPQTAPSGPAMTDWVAYTPVFSSGFGTVTGITAYYRRVGDSVQIRGTGTTGTTTTAAGTISMPSGLTGDSTKIASGSFVGLGSTAASTTNQYVNNAPLLVESAYGYGVVVYGNVGNGGSNNNLGAVGVSVIIGSSTGFSFTTELIPVTGWSSNTSMSSDTDTRVVAFNANGTPTGTVTGSYSLVKYPTTVSDTHGAYSSSTGLYTVPVTGYYDVSAGINITETSVSGGSASQIGISINGAAPTYAGTALGYANGTATTTVPQVNINGLLLAAGTTVSIQATSTGSSLSIGSGVQNYFCVSRRSGPAVIAATESVNADYGNSATSTIGTSATQLSFNTKNFDSHGAFSTNTYTCPVSGKYLVTTTVTTAAVTLSTSQNYTLYIYHNGSAYANAQLNGTGGSSIAYSQSLSRIVNCAAGDTIAIFANTSVATTMNGSVNYDFFSIARVGN